MARVICSFYTLEVGKAYRFRERENIIYNLVTKDEVTQKARGMYRWKYMVNLVNALADLRKQMEINLENYLAMPRIGSGLDGGNWEKIRELIEMVFDDSWIEIQICYP